MRRVAFFFAVFLSQYSSLLGQGSRSLLGTEFWMTFTENVYLAKDSVQHVIVTPLTRDTVRIYNPQLNLTETFPVSPGRQNNLTLNKLSYWYSPLSFGAQGTGVRISSKRPMQVQAVNTVDGSMDITSLLPKSAIENAREYLVNNIGGDDGKQSQVAIIAMDTGTTNIEIVAGTDLTGLGGTGTIITRKLKFGQVYVVQALGNQDLCGTRIKVTGSCKRIAVFCGTRCSAFPGNSGCNSCDAMYEQLWPIALWQTRFFVPAVPGNTKYSIKVLAQSANTSVFFGGVLEKVLNAGETYVKEISGVLLLESDKPVNVMQVLHSAGCNGAVPITMGDPSMVQVAGTNQKVNSALFSVYRNTNFTHHLVLWFEQIPKPTATINKVSISPALYIQSLIGGKSFWHATVSVTYNKTWALESDSNFVAYQYGMATNSSYAMLSAASFERSDVDFNMQPAVLCDRNKQVLFASRGDSVGSISWSFGDGNFDTGFTSSHGYGQSGTFNVQMLNTRNGTCPDTVSRLLMIYDGPQPILPKDTMPCIGVPVRIELPSDKGYIFTWENGSTSYLRTISSNRTAILTIADTNGCKIADTMKVEYRDCNIYDLRLANVFTPGKDGFNDVWKVFYTGYTGVHVRIFNRWGETVYIYDLPNGEHWNGQVHNQFIDCPEGVYFYQITAKAKNESDDKVVNGAIHLIRE
ncbi:MAG: gliding motility-associated C-terminal domain-containing protein [Bacteroidia bacterium]|nr:gliding motility-associated C-terminal domain-containing protein [Bacteroidia bacterium]